MTGPQIFLDFVGFSGIVTAVNEIMSYHCSKPGKDKMMTKLKRIWALPVKESAENKGAREGLINCQSVNSFGITARARRVNRFFLERRTGVYRQGVYERLLREAIRGSKSQKRRRLSRQE